MTQETKDKIESKYPIDKSQDILDNEIRPTHQNLKHYFQQQAAEYGYSLCLSELQPEVERLKELIKDLYNNYENVAPANIKWQQFKKDNKI